MYIGYSEEQEQVSASAFETYVCHVRHLWREPRDFGAMPTEIPWHRHLVGVGVDAF